MELDPAAVALKFGFIAVLYLFLLWVARSTLRDLRRTPGESRAEPDAVATPDYGDATGYHVAGAAMDAVIGMAKLRVEKAAGLRAGAAYDLSQGAVLGRGAEADIVLQDTFSSSRHAALTPQGETIILEDLGSTNGTYLNGEPLTGPQPLHDGDRIRIGDSEFSFER